MARKNGTAEPAEAAEPTFQVEESDYFPSGGRSSKPNPLTGAVKQSYDRDGKTLHVKVSTEDQAKQAERYIRSDAQTHGLGVRVKWERTDDRILVHYTGKDKKSYNYSAQDIRDWGAANGYDVSNGRVPEYVRDAFKVAHGYSSRE